MTVGHPAALAFAWVARAAPLAMPADVATLPIKRLPVRTTVVIYTWTTQNTRILSPIHAAF